METKEELLKKIANLEENTTDNEFISLEELSGKIDNEIIFEEEIKYFVKKGDKIKKIIGNIKIDKNTYVYLLDVITDLNKLSNITKENLEKVATFDKIDMFLDSIYSAKNFETGEEYLITDPLEKMKTMTAILNLSTPSIKEFSKENGNRETRRTE